MGRQPSQPDPRNPSQGLGLPWQFPYPYPLHQAPLRPLDWLHPLPRLYPQQTGEMHYRLPIIIVIIKNFGARWAFPSR